MLTLPPAEDRSVPIAIIAPVGRLDALTAPALHDRCWELQRSGTNRIVIDLGAVDFMDSAGLAALVRALRATRSAEGDVKLASPTSSSVWRILTLTRFDRVFDIAPTADEAVDRFLAPNARRAGR